MISPAPNRDHGCTAEDAALIAAACRGDGNAFGALVQRHQDRVYRFAMKQLGDRDIARELTQDTFLQAYIGLAGFRAEARFTTWLIGIALNLIRQHLRGRPPRGVEFADQEDTVGDAPAMADPALAAERNAMLAALQDAIDTLPPDLREPLVLVALEELGYEEAASLLQIPLGTVKSRINRARARLKSALKNHDLAACTDLTVRTGS